MHTIKRDCASYFLDQSTLDVPCRVRFAGESSLLSVSKWGGEATLCLAPGGEHEGKIEANGNEIILMPDATPKAQHVFRRLDGERFEYDVVLLKEPETNVIEIELDFPEGLEFYRQPSKESLVRSPYRCAPEVEESYAVYWKERNGPYKTGKFCHIYRPLIKDAKGRKVWGLLGIAGHTMTITIPEDWLSDASYPVVVDPIVGTQTRGALNQIEWWDEGEFQEFYFEMDIGFGRFTASTPITGACTSYIYSDTNVSSIAQAVVYSDSSGIPSTRLSRNEQAAQLQRSTPAWVSSTFTLPQTIPQGSAFWYGYYAQDAIYTYYDAVGLFRRYDTEELTDIPNTITSNYLYTETWTALMSAYFSYSTAQALNRSMMDTVGLTESFGRNFSFKRSCANSVQCSEVNTTKAFHSRVCTDSFHGIETVKRIASYTRTFLEVFDCTRVSSRVVMGFRFMTETIGTADIFSKIRIVVRLCFDGIALQELTNRLFQYRRTINEDVETAETFSMIQTLFRFCISVFSGVSSFVRSVGFFRNLTSALKFLERLLPRMVLKKEELIIVSRVTCEIEFKGDLL